MWSNINGDVMMDVEKQYACEWIETHKEKSIEISDCIWAFAELGLIETKSSMVLATELDKVGFTVKRGIADMPTAFLASWGDSRPVIGILGEYDALPGLSQKKVPWREPLEPGKPGHGCGHNIHGTSGMMAAITVKKVMQKFGLKGTIKYFGCPAEENFHGKVFLVREGYFDDVDVALSHHPSIMNTVSLANSIAVNSVKFRFSGVASHAAASPEQGKSALDAIELMNVGVNFLREHVPQDVRIHYIIEKGGEQPNIVPAHAQSWYYIRAPERDQVEYVYKWILDIAQAAAMMTRTKVNVDFIGGIYNSITNRTIAEVIIKNMREIEPPSYNEAEWKFANEIAQSITPEMKRTQLKQFRHPKWDKLASKILDDEVVGPVGDGTLMHGSTDVSDVSWQTPTIEFMTTTWVLGTPIHSWQCAAQSGVGLGHKSLIFAAKVMTATCIDILKKNEILKLAKEEHKRKIGDRKYLSPIASEMKPPINIWEK
jgi:aminobenzoyl-glutamate utilization protein B